MRSTWVRRAVIVTILAGTPLDLFGASVDGGAPNQVSGTNMSEQLVAEPFTIPYNTSFSEIRFWAIRSAPGAYRGSVYWAIHSEASGKPDQVVAGGVTAAISAVDTGQSTAFGYGEATFVVPVAFKLAPGAYWLALHNGPLADNSVSEMLWSTAADASAPAEVHGVVSTEALYLAGSAWVGTGNSLAFQLIDPALFANGFEVGDQPWTVPPPG